MRISQRLKQRDKQSDVWKVNRTNSDLKKMKRESDDKREVDKAELFVRRKAESKKAIKNEERDMY